MKIILLIENTLFVHFNVKFKSFNLFELKDNLTMMHIK